MCLFKEIRSRSVSLSSSRPLTVSPIRPVVGGGTAGAGAGEPSLLPSL